MIALLRAAAIAVLAALCLAWLLYERFLPRPGWERHGSELTAFAAALYWESALDEPAAGRRAIGQVILNRRDSRSFPDSVREVVAQGMKPGARAGCQFSFACDGEAELPRRLCELHPRDTAAFGWLGCERRWLRYLAAGAWMLYVDRGPDETAGADHYFTGPRPYWYDDLIPCTVRKIGSHTFGKARWTKGPPPQCLIGPAA